MDRVFERRVGMRHILIGLREAAAGLVIEPAVVIAAQPARLDIAIAEIGAAMPAMPVDEAPAPAEILVEHEVLTQQPHRLRARLIELAGAGDRPPISAQQLAHRRPVTGLRQQLPAAARLLCPVLRHRRALLLVATETVPERPCCMDQPVDAVIPCPRGLMRCGRSSGVPAPAYGSGPPQQLALRPLDARWFASAAHDR